MGVRRRGRNSWEVTVELGRDPLTGRRRRLSQTVRGTKRDAEAVRVHLLHRITTGTDLEPSRLTVGTYLERWLDAVRPNLAPTTRLSYEGLLRHQVIRYIGGDDSAGGSGLQDFSVYVSKDDGPFRPWLLFTQEASATFTGEPGSTYEFFSLARDAAGNSEPLKSEAEAVTTVLPPTVCRADVDGDGDVDIRDVALVFAHWPSPPKPYDATYDMDSDGDIDIRDVALAFGQWPSPPKTCTL